MRDLKPTSLIVREGFKRACRDFTERVAPLGFRHTRRTLWPRPRFPTIQYVYFHRSGSTYGAPRNHSVMIRVHFGIAVVGCGTEQGLTGPSSDAAHTVAGRYHLRFNAKSWSTYDRCIEDLVRFVLEVGEPWFRDFEDPKALLERADSPLDERCKAAVRRAAAGNMTPHEVATSFARF
ncbi:MAG TPA: hypothetical protein VFN91_14350, partial [Myxococcaceae bacterium]|nr:hypothetical protein [Myxococcaceae bacterium]